MYSKLRNILEGDVILFPSNRAKPSIQYQNSSIPVEKDKSTFDPKPSFHHWHDTQLNKQDGSSLTLQDAYEHYSRHALDSDRSPESVTSFKGRMADKGYNLQSIAGRARYIGIGLKRPNMNEGQVVDFKTRKEISPDDQQKMKNAPIYKDPMDATHSDFRRWNNKYAESTPGSHTTLTDAYQGYCEHCEKAEVYPHSLPEFSKLMKQTHGDKYIQDKGRTKIKDTTFYLPRHSDIDEGQVIYHDFGRKTIGVSTNSEYQRTGASAKSTFMQWYQNLRHENGASITSQNAYTHYSNYTKKNCQIPEDLQTFHSNMLNTGIAHQRIAGQGRYIGVSL
jgi:hypothetical protein